MDTLYTIEKIEEAQSLMLKGKTRLANQILNDLLSLLKEKQRKYGSDRQSI